MLSHLRFKRVFLFDVDLLVISEKIAPTPCFLRLIGISERVSTIEHTKNRA